MSYYIHQIPGRLRIKSPLLKRSQHGRGAEILLARIEGITAVTVNPLTGSMVIEYAPCQVDAAEIIDLLTREDYFDQTKAMTNDQYIHAKVARTGRIVLGAVSGAFVETALANSPLSLISILI